VTVASFLLLLQLMGKRISLPVATHSAALILVPATFLFLVGLYDDLRGLSAKLKFTAQILAGSVLYGVGLKVGLPAVPTEGPLLGRDFVGRNHFLGVVDYERV